MKNLWRALMLVWMVALSAILTPGSAYAASSYDDYYTSSPSVILFRDGCSQSVDISYTWDDYIHSSIYGSSFTNAHSGGSWGVSYLPHYNMSGGVSTASAAIVYWSESSTMAIDWTNWGYMVATGMSQGVLMELVNPGNGNPCSISVTSFGAGFISSNDGSVENYFFHGAISYPTGYEGPQVVSAQPGAKYVAMGDSFSSGEGNPPFEPETDTSENKCHRSSQAYPRSLQNDPDLNLGSMAFVACSGATTSDVLYGGPGEGNWGEGAQTEMLSVDTEMVTITIGGNDVGFVGYARNCVLSELFPLVTLYQSYGGCGSGTAAYTAVMANINSITFLNKLQLTYNAILEDAPNAKVYVIDYPLIFGDQNDPYGCSIADGSGAYAVETALNATISNAVQAVRGYNSDYGGRLVYVNTNESSSPFTDEYLCAEGTNGSAFRDVTLPSTEYSLHPNVRGHQDFTQILKGHLD